MGAPNTTREYSGKPLRMDEDFYEQAIIEHLVNNHGYTYLYGPDVVRSSKGCQDVYLYGALWDSLSRINPTLPYEAIEQAVTKLENVETGRLEHRNEVFSDWLQSGLEVRFFDGIEERDDIVYLLDYHEPSNNDFHVVNQWTFIEHSNKRPDLVIFVNGMPLVVFELKSPSRAETDASEAYLQLRNYMQHIPSFFVPNAFCVMTDLGVTRVGTITAKEDRYMAWKSVDGDYSNTGNATWMTMVDGMLAKERLVDIVHNFICFNNDGKRTVKILAAYHQYFAVRKAVARAIEAVEGDGKIGVFWHTQGSGKSLSVSNPEFWITHEAAHATLHSVSKRPCNHHGPHQAQRAAGI